MIDSNEGTGHNSTAEKLKQFVARVEKLEEEKSEIAEDIKEVYAEAKALGFEASIIRIIVRRRKEDENKRKEREALVDAYEAAIQGQQLNLFKQDEGRDDTQEQTEDGEEDGDLTDEDEDDWQDDEDLQG